VLYDFTGHVFSFSMTECDAKNASRMASPASSIALACTLTYLGQNPWRGIQTFRVKQRNNKNPHIHAVVIAVLPHVRWLLQVVATLCAPGMLLLNVVSDLTAGRR